MSSSIRKVCRLVWLTEAVFLIMYIWWITSLWFKPGPLGRHGWFGRHMPAERAFLQELVSGMQSQRPQDKTIDEDGMQALVKSISEELEAPCKLQIRSGDDESAVSGDCILEFLEVTPEDMNAIVGGKSMEAVVVALRRTDQRSWMAVPYGFVRSYAPVVTPQRFTGVDGMALRDISLYSEEWGLAYKPGP